MQRLKHLSASLLEGITPFFVLTLSIYAVLIVVTAYFRHSIPGYFLPLLLFFTGLASYALVWWGTKPQSLEVRPISAYLAAGALFLPFLPGLLALLLSTRMQISVHGFFHSAYTYQILQGVIPPENITLPGTVVNTYWPYHAILAVLTMIFEAPPPGASTWLNIGLFLLTLRSAYVLVRSLTGVRQLFAGTALAIFAVFAINLFGLFHTWMDTDRNYIRPAVLSGDFRVSNMFEKYLNVTGFPAGVLFYIFILAVLGKAIQEKRFTRFDLICISLAAYGALLVHTTTGGFIVLILSAALAGTYLLSLWFARPQPALPAVKRHVAVLLEFVRNPRTVLVLLALAGMAAAVGWTVYSVSSALPAKSELDQPDMDDVVTIVGVTYPLIPLFLTSAYLFWKRKYLAGLFLVQICLMGTVLAMFTSLPDGNEYKFILLTVLALGFVAAYALYELWRKPRLRILVILALLMVNVNTLMVGLHRLRMPWFRDATFSFQGRHAAAEPAFHPEYPDLPYSDIFAWARQHTPANTVIVAPKVYKDDAVLYLLSERTAYLVDGSIYNNKMRVKVLREQMLEDLYSSESGGAEILDVLQDIRRELPERPILFIFPYDERAPKRLATSVPPWNIYTGKYAVSYYFPAKNNHSR